MATLNGNLGGFKDNKMNCGAGKLISAEHLLPIHGDDCAFCMCSRSFTYRHTYKHTAVKIFCIDNFPNVCTDTFFMLRYNSIVMYLDI